MIEDHFGMYLVLIPHCMTEKQKWKIYNLDTVCCKFWWHAGMLPNCGDSMHRRVHIY